MNSIPEILARFQRAEYTSGEALELIREHIAQAVNEAADRDGFAMQAMNARCSRTPTGTAMTSRKTPTCRLKR